MRVRVNEEQIEWIKKHNVEYTDAVYVWSVPTLERTLYRVTLVRDEDIVNYSLRWM